MDLKIAVISDLHCHNKSANSNIQESYLLTDVPIPDNQNPLKSFKKLIEKNRAEGTPLTADVLIMPGDITNKCDQDGYEFAWQIVKEIGALLNVKTIIPTVGNHDIDSRQKHSKDPFDKVKTFADDFPFISSSLNQEYWDKGYVFVEDDEYRILVLNSAFDHKTHADAEHGNLSSEMLNEISEKLDSLDNAKKRYNIAICHHHPLPHERHNLGTSDLMYNGTQLLELLGLHDFQIIIHGHKHDPFLRYSSGGTSSPVVFSSGSFSAFKNLLLQGAYNTFHMITLEENDKPYCENQGYVDTWFFTPSKGWDKFVNNEYFFSKTGFGCRTSTKQIATDIHKWFQIQSRENFEWKFFLNHFEMVTYLTPYDQIKLGKTLSDLNINVYPHFPQEPELISFNR